MSLEYRLRRNITIIVGILAIFWHFVTKFYPNPWFRIFYFSIVFATTTYGICLGYTKWVIHRSKESET